MNRSPESTVTLQVLGPVSLRRGPGRSPVPELTQPRQLAVLSYLVLARPRRLHSRDTLLALLWPEADQARGRHALRNVLHAIRKVVGEAALVAGGDGLVGVEPTQVHCDALEAEERIARREWELALALYQGELLAGFHVAGAAPFEEWLAGERTRVRDLMVSAAGALADARLQASDLPGAIRATERRIQLAPGEEAAHRQLMRLLVAHGEPAEARRAYDRLEARMRTEFDAAPSPDTRELLGTLLRSSAPAPPGPVVLGPASGPADPAPEPVPARAPAQPTPPRGLRGYLLAVVLVVFLISGAVLASRTGPGSLPPPATLFLAPVENATGDSTATWLGEGLTISLRETFRRTGWHLVPESQVRRALREHSTPLAAARSVAATYLLSGRADSVGGRLRLQLSAEMLDGEQPAARAEVLVQPNRLRDAELAVVQRVLEQLRPDLAAESVVAGLRRGTGDDAAFRFLLQGWYLWDRRYSVADMRLAAARFDSALAHDPVFPDALAARARVRFALAWSGNMATAQGLAAARADSRRAVELDSTSRVALSVLGAVETFHDSAAGRRLLERAVALDPDRSDTFFLLGLHYGFRGQYAFAERAYRRAIDLDPLTPFLYSRLVAVQVCQGAFAPALASIAQWRAIAARPELEPDVDYREASLLLALGRWSEAVPLLQRALPGAPELVAALGRVRSRAEVDAVLRGAAGRADAAEAVRTLTGLSLGLARASVAMWGGRRDQAIRLLREARDAGDIQLPTACEEPQLQQLLAVPEVAHALRLAQLP